MRLYIGLLHYPVYNKHHEIIASAITSLNLHDLSRLARTYGVKRFFVITPLQDQQRLAERIRSHWTKGYGAIYNSHRKMALELIEIVPSLQKSIKKIIELEGEAPLLIATDASEQENRSITHRQTRDLLNSQKVVILIFGTAWGLDKEVMNQADYILEPIRGCIDYNHLSVRTAAAIILDRLATK